LDRTMDAELRALELCLDACAESSISSALA
jgi:hypothetical protein